MSETAEVAPMHDNEAACQILDAASQVVGEAEQRVRELYERMVALDPRDPYLQIWLGQDLEGLTYMRGHLYAEAHPSSNPLPLPESPDVVKRFNNVLPENFIWTDRRMLLCAIGEARDAATRIRRWWSLGESTFRVGEMTELAERLSYHWARIGAKLQKELTPRVPIYNDDEADETPPERERV